MFNLRKETIKKNVLLIFSIISAFIFIAGLMCTVLGDDSPVKFIVNGSPIKLIVPPILVFIVSFVLYIKSKNTIKENTK